MSENDHSWKLITLPFDENMHDALHQQHYAAQFIALAGRHLIPQQPDDSNTNMFYDINKYMLIGNLLSNGSRLGLVLIDFEILLLNENFHQINKIELVKKSWQQVFQELKQCLAESGIDISKLREELHYEIPYHPIVDGAKFFIHDKNYFKENAIYRQNAELVLEAVRATYKDSSPVRIWPHHFDTATNIPFGFNRKGDISKFVGLGWAIPDAMVDEPYYYLNYWSEDFDENIVDLPELDKGEWMMPEWNGAVLRQSEILQYQTADAQYELVKSFFESGITIQNYIN